MKYLGKSFSSPPNSAAYRDGWEATFGEKPQPTGADPAPCSVCGMWPDSGVHWQPAWGGGHEYVEPGKR